LEEDDEADDGDVGDGSECDAGGGGGSSKNKLLNWGFCKLITKGELGGLVAGSSIRLHDDGMLISIRPTSMEGGDGRYGRNEQAAESYSFSRPVGRYTGK
jgi:hypothetical protein